MLCPAIVWCSVLVAGYLPAATLSSSSQATCYQLSPVSSQSSSQPIASSGAACGESFSFSNSVASASGTAAFGNLTAAGNAGDKDITTGFQTSESFADTLYLYGTAPAGGVEVQFNIQTQGFLTEETFVGQMPTFTLLFSAGGIPLSVSQTCSVACIFTYQYSFSQGYQVTVSDANLSAVSFSALLGLAATAEAGTGGGNNDSAQLESIALLDPQTGLPVSGLSYSTDSGTQYNINASYVPEPGSVGLLTAAIAILGLGCRKLSTDPT
jgi:hypothetical protein